jgi:hypothetical protein
MSSEIDPAVFRDDQKIAKSDLREQFQIAANEITALQLITSYIRRMAYDDASFDTL